MKTRIGVVIPRPRQQQLFAPPDRERLDELGDVRWCTGDEQLTMDEAAEFLRGCQVGVGSWDTVHPCEDLLTACPELRMWEHVAGTVKHMFGSHMQGRELTIATCAPAIAENVAEMSVGELIVGIRGILPNAASGRESPPGKAGHRLTLDEATVGVVAASQVGRAVLRMLQTFDCRVLLYDPFVSAEEAAALGAEKIDDLLALCAASDAVTLHTPAIPATRHMMGEAAFKAMPDHATFVNTARGMCVDEAALIAELEQGRLFAFLDVSDPEPAVADSPFRRLPNVVYTSHMAGGPSVRLGTQAVDDIAAFLKGESPRMAVTEDMLERLA